MQMAHLSVCEEEVSSFSREIMNGFANSMTGKNAQKEKDFRGTHRDIFWGGFITLGWNGGNALLSVTPHLLICTSKWTRSEAINDGFGDIGMSLEITINKKQTGYGEVTIFSLVNLLTFYSIMDVVQGIMKCSVIDGASCSFRGLQDPLLGGWRAARSTKRHPLCLQPQQLPQGLDCGLLSTVRPTWLHRAHRASREKEGSQRVFRPLPHFSLLSLKTSSHVIPQSLSECKFFLKSWGTFRGYWPFRIATIQHWNWILMFPLYQVLIIHLLSHREVWGITGEDSWSVEGNYFNILTSDTTILVYDRGPAVLFIKPQSFSLHWSSFH